MASSENDRHQDDSANRRRAARNRKIEPPRKAPQTERGLTHSPYFNGPLYQRMSEDLHLGGMARRTHEGYLRAVRQLADFCKTSPDQITEDQLRKFFLHLKTTVPFVSGTFCLPFCLLPSSKLGIDPVESFTVQGIPGTCCTLPRFLTRILIPPSNETPVFEPEALAESTAKNRLAPQAQVSWLR